MKRSLLVCIGILALALTAGAQIPNNYRKAPQRATTYPGYRGTSAVRHAVPQRTISPARYRQPAFSSARFREPMYRTTRMEPRMTTSLRSRPTTTSDAAWRRRPMPPTNDWRESKFSPRPRPTSSFVNRPTPTTSRQSRLATANDFRASRLSPQPRLSNSFVNKSRADDARARPVPRQPFNKRWADPDFSKRGSSFVNRSQSAAFWNGRRAVVTNNWSGSEFSGRQYGAFRSYRRQWHDSGWWHYHCGDRIVFVTVYSQPFPFYFDAGYWYPAWGYYPDSYYPYDGPIYGYNDLPPDEVIANVQTQLYNEGYYDGPIDGILGPDTRAAIADYQADHGLAVTAAIDQPTVESLGLG